MNGGRKIDLFPMIINNLSRPWTIVLVSAGASWICHVRLKSFVVYANVMVFFFCTHFFLKKNPVSVSELFGEGADIGEQIAKAGGRVSEAAPVYSKIVF